MILSLTKFTLGYSFILLFFYSFMLYCYGFAFAFAIRRIKWRIIMNVKKEERKKGRRKFRKKRIE